MKLHFVQTSPKEIRLAIDYEGKPGGVAHVIGSTALVFRPRRTGSHRGEKMKYQEFTPEDVVLAKTFAAASELLAACKDALKVIATHIPVEQPDASAG